MRLALKFTAAALSIAVMLLATTSAGRAGDEYVFEGVERIVAVGDLHGDFEAYAEVMEAAGVRDSGGKWTGGRTHLVQMGDIVDRGPDSKEILDDLRKLAKRAKKAGGRVHILLGNHELMNMVGAVSYVTPEEYAAFRGIRSQRRLDSYFERKVEPTFENEPPERRRELEEEWYRKHPPGFIEHRLEWSKGGRYFERAIEFPVVIRINDTLFAHAGIPPKYAGVELATLNGLVRQQIENLDQEAFDQLFAEDALLWYRGFALEEGEEFAAFVDQLLARYGAERFVVAHTPTGGVVLPRLGGRVVITDTGISAFYGGHRAFLLFEDGAWSGVHWGEKIPLPGPGREALIAYLERAAEASEHPDLIVKRVEALKADRGFSLLSPDNGEESSSPPPGDR